MMEDIIGLSRRNCLLFFRDKGAVAGALMGAIIVLMLYILFIKNTMGEMCPGDNGGYLLDSWVMGGLIAVSSITASLGSFGTLVTDREGGTMKLFRSSPMSPIRLTAGYVMSSYFIAMILALFSFVFAEVYIVACGGRFLSLSGIVCSIGIIALGTLSACALMFFVASFFTSNRSFTGISVIVGTIVGFLAGAYMPVGSFPSSMQNVLAILPVTNQASLLRKIFMDDPQDLYFGADADISEFAKEMGETLFCGSFEITTVISILILAVSGIVFMALAAVNLSRKI